MKKNFWLLMMTTLLCIAASFGCNKNNNGKDSPASGPAASRKEAPAANEQADKQPVRDQQNHAPMVTGTEPANGASDVDPNTTELRVTFDKDMMTERMWSFVNSQEGAAPEYDLNGIRFIGKRTCAAPVKLKPGTHYVIWINSDKYQNFMGANGTPAVPYKLEFTTKP